MILQITAQINAYNVIPKNKQTAPAYVHNNRLTQEVLQTACCALLK